MDKEYIESLKRFSKTLNVLYVEDNKEARDSTFELLEMFFTNIIVLTNGEDGLNYFLSSQTDNIHLIITDINMPKLNGLDMVEKIKEHNNDIYVLVLSAYEESEYLLKSINIQVNGYLLKPICTYDFIFTLAKILKQIKKQNIISFDIIFLNSEIYLNSKTNILSYKNENIELRKREKDFLLLLNKNKNNITSYEEIEQYLWQDKIMTLNALKSFIKEIRRKIPIDIIENISKVGYKLKYNNKKLN